MDGFFDRPSRPGESSVYAGYRDDGWLPEFRARADSLLLEYLPICPDSDFLSKAQDDPLAMYWQMYLSVHLLRSGYKLEKSSPDAPDICIRGDRDVWIECTALTPGHPMKPDSVPTPRLESGKPVARSAPEREILLRITNAVSEKAVQTKNRIAKGIINSDDIVVLAVCGGKLGMDAFGGLNNYAERAMFGLGNLELVIDRASHEITQQQISAEPFVLKAPQATTGRRVAVSTAEFLGDNLSFISALLWAPMFDVNGRSHHDMVTVHNLHPTTRLPRGYFRFGWEAYMEVTSDNDLVLFKKKLSDIGSTMMSDGPG